MSSVAEPEVVPPVQLTRERLAEQLRQLAIQIRSCPLSFAQERLWFFEQLEPGTAVYNMPLALRLKGNLHLPSLESALNSIVSRHESLRTRLTSTEGEPAQIIDEERVLKLQVQPLSQGEAELQRLVREEATAPFQLEQEHLFRVKLLRLGDREHVLMLNMHHIISDEWSFRVFFNELCAFYRGVLNHEAARVPELPIQYGDYALWQRDWLKSSAFVKQLDFWKAQLSGNPAPVELPVDHARRANTTWRGAVQWRLLNRELSQSVKELAHTEKVTLFMLLLAAFKALLHRYTGQDDIIVGTPFAGRTRVETENLIGFFVNTLPLRTRLSGEESFLELLRRVRETSLEAFSNQDLPFEKLVQELQPERSLGQTPYINVMFHVQPGLEHELELPCLIIESLGGATETSKFDMTLRVAETFEGLEAGLEYRSELFEPETISRFLEHYENLLAGIVADPRQSIYELALLSAAERNKVLVEFNRTGSDYGSGCSIHELFEQQASRNAEAPAVCFGSLQLSYHELNERANQLAGYLRRSGVMQGDRVAICLERSVEMVVTLLAILKAGAAYAALSPGDPKQRLAALVNDLQPALIVTEERFYQLFSEKRPPTDGPLSLNPSPLRGEREKFGNHIGIVCLDAERKVIERENKANPGSKTKSEELAYVSFTSGSTGQPKGVCVPHRAVVRLVRHTNYASFSNEDVFLQMAPLAFDASTFEIWGALLNGARVVVVPSQVPSLGEVAEVIRREGVTTAWFTSGFFNELVDEMPQALQPLRQILTGGDILSPPHIAKALSWPGERRLINGYGPTENTTFTACYTIAADFDPSGSVPIGRPISNTRCYVLDGHMQPVPIGVPGELYAGGEGLALGYWNQPQLTAERFVSDPFEPGQRLYKTGDLVRWLPDGNLEFLGRRDLQVKIRGFRIELGEIETVLLKHPGVRQCTVIAKSRATGAKELVAYVVAEDSSEAASAHSDWEQFLRERLPDYMVPNRFVSLDSLPLSKNGKVDRHALPEPAAEPSLAGANTPKDEIERKLKSIWEDVLQVRSIGINDGFFALGGHSLLAVRLLARVEKEFGQRLRVATVFQYPTIEQFAGVLRGTQESQRPDSIVEIKPHGNRPPLMLVHGAGGGMFWGYSNLAKCLGEEQPLFGFKSRGLDGLPEYETIETMAEAYLADLRKFQPCGPYFLGGYCFGGLVAYEMACRLEDAGEKVGMVALINSNPPNSSYGNFRWTPFTAYHFAKNVFLRGVHFLRGPRHKLLAFLEWKARNILKRSHTMLRGSSTSRPPTLDEWLDMSIFPEEERRVWEVHTKALVRYYPPRYRGHVTLFRSPLHLLYCSFDPLYGWGELAMGGVTLRIIPGAHETIMEGGVQRLAREVSNCLAEAQKAFV